MNKNSIFIIGTISIFFVLSIFAYKKQNAPLHFANTAIKSIDLKYFKARAVIQKSNPEKEQLAKADLLFESSPLKAAGIYQDLLKKDPGKLDLRMRLGMLQLKNQQYEAAREHLHMIYEQQDAVLQPDAAWFLALLAIVEGNSSSAKQFLEESLKSGSQYQEDAKLLHQLLP